MLPRRRLRSRARGRAHRPGVAARDELSAGPHELLAELVLAVHANPGPPAISVPHQARALETTP